MRSDLPKVCHEVGDEAMVCAVVRACRAAGCDRIVVVVGYQQELVREALAGEVGEGVEFVVQPEQLGTGHAVRMAEPAFALEPGRDVFVLCGDGPLIRSETLATLLDRHRSTGASATLATSVVDDPEGYGRIVRDDHGRFVGIVEHKNASEQQLAIREINPSYYCFVAAPLFEALGEVERDERSGEYYVTDVPSLLSGRGHRVEVIEAVPPEDVLSINTPEDLARVDRIYRSRGSGCGDGRTARKAER